MCKLLLTCIITLSSIFSWKKLYLTKQNTSRHLRYPVPPSSLINKKDLKKKNNVSYISSKEDTSHFCKDFFHVMIGLEIQIGQG